MSLKSQNFIKFKINKNASKPINSSLIIFSNPTTAEKITIFFNKICTWQKNYIIREKNTWSKMLSPSKIAKK